MNGSCAFSRIARFSTFIGLAFCLGIFLSLGAPPAWSQATSTGTVSGQVTDAQGAIIPGAEIKVTDVSTNIARTTVSNDAGRYIFVDVPPGTYNITISKSGFSTYQIAAQKVDVGQVLTIN